MRDASKAHNGYSLFELAIVLALLTLIFSFSAYVIVSADYALVRRDVDRLYAVLVYMQRKAWLDGKPCSVTFAIKKNCYKADQIYTLSKGVVFAAPDKVLGPPSAPTAFIKESLTWSNNAVTFYPDGTMSAGAVYLTNAKKTQLYALTCDACAVTHIRRYRYEGCWILLH